MERAGDGEGGGLGPCRDALSGTLSGALSGALPQCGLQFGELLFPAHALPFAPYRVLRLVKGQTEAGGVGLRFEVDEVATGQAGHGGDAVVDDLAGGGGGHALFLHEGHHLGHRGRHRLAQGAAGGQGHLLHDHGKAGGAPSAFKARNLSTTLRQLVFEIRLGLARFSWAG